MPTFGANGTATTDWALTIDGSRINLATTQNIEIFLRHRYVSRVKP
ncbi:hypothetical protein N8564_04450 [Verrucomicrobiales bacterium]|nr:hypothetical protein [Verrucomicrobiales bacterium]